MSKDIFTELQEIVDRMGELDIIIDQHHAERDELQERLRLIRARHHVAVALEKDDSGKPLYPSEKVREAAITVHLSEDPEYLELRKKIKSKDWAADYILEFNRLVDRKQLLMLEIKTISGESISSDLRSEKRSKRFQRP